MKQVTLNKNMILLPECWNDLNADQYIYTVHSLLQLQEGKISLEEFRRKLLIYYTSYKSSGKKYIKQGVKIRYILHLVLAWLKYRIWQLFKNINQNGFKSIMKSVRNRYKPEVQEENTREIIALNLIKLSEMITFPLVEKAINMQFTSNPLPMLKKIGVGKKFDIGVVPITNFTAGEFADAMDIAIGWRQTKSVDLLDILVAIIYPSDTSHTLEKAKFHAEKIKAFCSYAQKYAVYIWFSSIAHYFSLHPYYSLLYAGKKEGVEEHIHLGTNEGIIHLSERGYGSHSEMRNKNLIEFMDIQLSDLKRNICNAIAIGTKPSDIADKTGLTVSQINMLT